MYLRRFQYRFSLIKLYAKLNYFHIAYGPVLECKHSAPVDVYLCLAYVSPFENNFIDSHGNVQATTKL